MKRFWVNPNFKTLLEREGLLSFEDLWRVEAQLFKQKKDREICYLELQGRAFYLKRYFRLPFWGPSGAEREWLGARRLLELGFGVPVPVCFGLEKGFFFGRALSLFEAARGVRLEDLFREFFLPEVISRLAEVAGRFHSLGFSHQDFYLCHFFWDEKKEDLTIIDLQRLRWSPRPRRRWIIKDIAELFYAARETFPPEEYHLFREKFLAVYTRFVPWAREEGFMAKVEKKIRRIARHDQKLKEKRPPQAGAP